MPRGAVQSVTWANACVLQALALTQASPQKQPGSSFCAGQVQPMQEFLWEGRKAGGGNGAVGECSGKWGGPGRGVEPMALACLALIQAAVVVSDLCLRLAPCPALSCYLWPACLLQPKLG